MKTGHVDSGWRSAHQAGGTRNHRYLELLQVLSSHFDIVDKFIAAERPMDRIRTLTSELRARHELPDFSTDCPKVARSEALKWKGRSTSWRQG
jgi:hypothetical protein